MMNIKEDIREFGVATLIAMTFIAVILVIGILVTYAYNKEFSQIVLSPRTEVYNGEFIKEYCFHRNKVTIKCDSIQFTDPRYKTALIKGEIKDLRAVLKIGNKIVPSKPFLALPFFGIKVPKICLSNPVKQAVIVIYSGKKKIGEGKVKVEVRK